MTDTLTEITDKVTINRVQTASGRVYEFDLEGGYFRTIGDQEFAELVYTALIDSNDPHHEWTRFIGLDVDGDGRLHIVEPSGYWRRSTRIVSGLAEFVDALDGAE